MAGKPAADKSPRTNSVVQVCLTPDEKAHLVAYANATSNGKLSIAARALLRDGLMAAS